MGHTSHDPRLLNYHRGFVSLLTNTHTDRKREKHTMLFGTSFCFDLTYKSGNLCLPFYTYGQSDMHQVRKGVL